MNMNIFGNAARSFAKQITRGTLSSDLFCKTSGSISKDIHIHVQNGDGLVSLIESGNLNSPETLTLLKKYLSPMMAQNIDCLVLGCTHYPYLIPQIKFIVGEKVTLIDSGFAVAKQLERILIAHNLLNKSSLNANHQFYCNADIKVLKTILKEVNEAKIDFINF